MIKGQNGKKGQKGQKEKKRNNQREGIDIILSDYFNEDNIEFSEEEIKESLIKLGYIEDESKEGDNID